MHDIGDVGAEQNEFALAKLKIPHHAGDDAKSHTTRTTIEAKLMISNRR